MLRWGIPPFDIIQMDGDEYEVEFNFENESLKHKLNNTMRKNMMEVSTMLLKPASSKCARF